MFRWVAADFSLLTILLAAGWGWAGVKIKLLRWTFYVRVWLVAGAGAGAGAGSCVENYHKAGDHGRSLQTREREQQLQEAVN